MADRGAFWEKSFTHLYPLVGGGRRHQVELNLTIHTKDSSVYAEAKPFIALNKSDGEKALTLEYPTAE